MSPRSERRRPRRLLWQIVFGALVAGACGTTARRAPFGQEDVLGAAASGASAASGGRAPSVTGRGGAQENAGAGGEAGAIHAAEAGRADSNDAGAPSAGATSAAGAAGSDELDPGYAGAPGESGPPPVPVCSPAARWGAGRVLSLSTANDEELEAVTPDELTLVYSDSGRFYVADRSSPHEDFGAPVEVARELGFSSVTVSSDGLRLVGASTNGFSEITRPERTEPFADVPDASAFTLFNAAVLGTPTNEVALEPLLGLNDTVLVYSYVSPSNEAARPTLFASEWLGEWSSGQALLGSERLWAAGQSRRIATGISSDGLTLFYRDEVEGEFRSAWRRRLSEPFDAFQALGELARAAPNGACDELYYSAAGDGGLDLFVADAL